MVFYVVLVVVYKEICMVWSIWLIGVLLNYGKFFFCIVIVDIMSFIVSLVCVFVRNFFDIIIYFDVFGFEKFKMIFFIFKEVDFWVLGVLGGEEGFESGLDGIVFFDVFFFDFVEIVYGCDF